MDTLSVKNEQLNTGSSKRTFLIMLAVFALPVILAKLALQFQWLNYGVTNKGVLVEHPFTLQQLEVNTSLVKEHWVLVINVPRDCQTHCQQTLQTVYNTYIALGKDKPRVKALALLPPNDLANLQQKLTKQGWLYSQSNTKANKQLNNAKVFIADPLGNVVLSHTIPQKTTELNLFGKQILADMKKLLKYSKVG